MSLRQGQGGHELLSEMWGDAERDGLAAPFVVSVLHHRIASHASNIKDQDGQEKRPLRVKQVTDQPLRTRC